jgi:leucyl aminopeptidase
MRHMKSDMAGSASALGTFLALTESGIECFIFVGLGTAEVKLSIRGLQSQQIRYLY